MTSSLYFNPRTHEGCDNRNENHSGLQDNFNPRTHEGCDIIENCIWFAESEISIPAPTKGATGRRICGRVARRYFNPRTHEGCDFFAFLFRV